MRILYLITELDRGGAEQALFQVACGVRAAGHEVCVASLFHGAGAVGRDLCGAGIAVHDLGAYGLHLGVRWRFRELCAEFEPDLIHSWLFRANVFCRWFAPRSTPLICSARVRENRLVNILLERFAPRTYTQYLCVSESVAAFARAKLRIPQNGIGVIGNGVDFHRFAPARDRRSVRNGFWDAPETPGSGVVPRPPQLTGLTVARAVPEKGLDILLEGLAALPPGIDWRWHVAGAATDKRYYEKLKARLAGSDCAGRVVWHGAVDPDRLLELYGAADLFALPSRYEGQPNVVLEALACGLPTLTTQVDGIRELLDRDQQALRIVAPNTPMAWKDAIAGLCQTRNTAEALSCHAVALATATTWQRVVDKHLKAYMFQVRFNDRGALVASD